MEYHICTCQQGFYLILTSGGAWRAKKKVGRRIATVTGPEAALNDLIRQLRDVSPCAPLAAIDRNCRCDRTGGGWIRRQGGY